MSILQTYETSNVFPLKWHHRINSSCTQEWRQDASRVDLEPARLYSPSTASKEPWFLPRQLMIWTISWRKLIRSTTLLPPSWKSTEESISTCFFYGDSHAIITPYSSSIQKCNNVSCCGQLRSPVEKWHMGHCHERQPAPSLIRNVHAISCAVLMLRRSFPKVMRHR